MSDLSYPSADLSLACRLERAEAMANAAFVEARAVVAPEVGAAWIDVAGVYAMFEGVCSPLTQTFGLGVFEECLTDEFARLESFFEARGASTSHEVSSHAADATRQLLPARGYAPIEQSVVLIRSTAVDRREPGSRIAVRRAAAEESAEWARRALLHRRRGWAPGCRGGAVSHC